MNPRLWWYLVARGASGVSCTAHGWRAFRDPEEQDVMSPCPLAPISMVRAKNTREAVATMVSRMAAAREEDEGQRRQEREEEGTSHGQ